jgi:hypothetical protein
VLNHRYVVDQDHQGTRVRQTIDDSPPLPPVPLGAVEIGIVLVESPKWKLLDTGR